MKPLTKAIVVALIHAAIVCSLGAKLLYDRQTCPRAWFRATKYDPNLPIRGRYLSLQLQVKDPLTPEEVEKKYKNQLGVVRGRTAAPAFPRFPGFGPECGSIDVSSGKPVAVFDSSASTYDCPHQTLIRQQTGNEVILRVVEPVLFLYPARPESTRSCQRRGTVGGSHHPPQGPTTAHFSGAHQPRPNRHPAAESGLMELPLALWTAYDELRITVWGQVYLPSNGEKHERSRQR